MGRLRGTASRREGDQSVRYALAIDTLDNFKKSHELIPLAAPLLTACPGLLNEVSELTFLTNHSFDGRYPGPRSTVYQAPFKTYDAETAESALFIAQEIVERCSRLSTDLQAFWRAR